MQKALFLEYKFGDYDTKVLRRSGANLLIAWADGLTEERIAELKKLGIPTAIALPAFVANECPANPRAMDACLKRIKEALLFGIQNIWLDHFRFPGRWETAGGGIKNPHVPCRFCKRKNRVSVLKQLAKRIKNNLPNTIQLNYFAVPLEKEKQPDAVSILGQDHKALAPFFSSISPMLYHRMLGKPPSFISNYVSYLAHETKLPILPAIQVKDMPDSLTDKLTEVEMKRAYIEAIKSPSQGVLWFSWDAALEKKKTQTIRELFFR